METEVVYLGPKLYSIKNIMPDGKTTYKTKCKGYVSDYPEMIHKIMSEKKKLSDENLWL